MLPPDDLDPASLPVPLEERDGHHPKATADSQCERRTKTAQAVEAWCERLSAPEGDIVRHEHG